MGRTQVQARIFGDRETKEYTFLVDTGADRSVLSAPILVSLSLQPIMTHDRLAGLGGIADVVVVETQVRLTHEEFGKIIFRGQYAAVTELEVLDMSVLGRDITDLFAVLGELGPRQPKRIRSEWRQVPRPKIPIEWLNWYSLFRLPFRGRDEIDKG